MHQYIPEFSSFRKFCVVQTFLVERHLDVVLGVLQVVISKFHLYDTCRYLPLKDSLKIRMVALLMTEKLKLYNNCRKKRVLEVSAKKI